MQSTSYDYPKLHSQKELSTHETVMQEQLSSEVQLSLTIKDLSQSGTAPTYRDLKRLVFNP